ncbi:MAG: hypothetical protein MZW92_52215 [Comamonadaceae bacterium]|nr:hypothetical protein [Comamonadaceae bacterium]
MVSLRGVLVPVVDLARYAGVQRRDAARDHDRHRVQRSYPGLPGRGGRHHPAPGLVADARAAGNADGQDRRSGHRGDRACRTSRLVMMLDVEKVLADTTGLRRRLRCSRTSIACPMPDERTVFFADDSSVAPASQIAADAGRAGRALRRRRSTAARRGTSCEKIGSATPDAVETQGHAISSVWC